MKLENLFKGKIVSSTLILKLELETFNITFTREYYLAKYQDDSYLLFVTSDEYDHQYTEQVLYDNWTILLYFDHIIANMNNIPTLDVIGFERKNLSKHIPNFIHFKPLFIDKVLSDILKAQFDETIFLEIKTAPILYKNNFQQWLNKLGLQ